MSKTKQQKPATPDLPPSEVTLDFLKYNVYLLFKATCAQVVAQTTDLKDPKEIAIEADRLAKYLQSVKAD